MTGQPPVSGNSERYSGQVARALAAGLSEVTIESVRQGCYSDKQLTDIIERRTSMAGAHARDQARLTANRDLRHAIAQFFAVRGEDRLPATVRETLSVVDEQLAAESAQIVRRWD